MESAKKNRARVATRSPVQKHQLTSSVSDTNTNSSGFALQELRTAWLRRRLPVNPDLAIFLATLALGERA